MRCLSKASVSRRQRMAFSERYPDGNPTGRPSSVISTSSPVSGASKEWLRMPSRYANGVPQNGGGSKSCSQVIHNRRTLNPADVSFWDTNVLLILNCLSPQDG